MPENKINNKALGPTLQNWLGGSDAGVTFFQNLVPNLVTLGLIVGSLAFFFYLLLGAIQWIISGGDKAAVESARGKITSALIGIVIMFGLFAIIKAVEAFFGTNILTLDLGVLKIQ